MTEDVATSDEGAPHSWIERIGREESKKDRLAGQNLIGEFVAVFVLSCLLWFFVAHKLEGSGFFTDDFGSLEMFMVYFGGAFALLPVVLRILVRRRNVVRPVDVASMLFLSSAHAVLLASFPFDFEHVDAVLPSFLQWTVSWMSDSIGAAVLAIGLFGGLIAASFTFVIYIAVKRELSITAGEDESQPLE